MRPVPSRSNRDFQSRARTHRRGVTLVEQLVVLAIVGILLTLALLRTVPMLDAVVVETGAAEAADLLAYARDHAYASGARTAVHIDAPHRRMTVHAGADTLARADFADRRLTLQTTRDSMAYGGNALGVGAANLRLIISRGARADTLTISRLGRVQRR
ncbi:MAG: prepilin-type N-terminal cleavage/methylation domain-containing protein [Gemmatimonadaceae bacterium]|nr:prepilin-type N-terminal cleavage/methylation domain-containing protein [Gemmatimonadaceae bacterium]